MDTKDLKPPAQSSASSPGSISSDKAFTQSLEVWYNDGSIVIVTEKTAFRVHTSILGANCEVFRDMAAIPQPSSDSNDQSETYEGCPVIRLQDSAVDMKHLLKAIYDFNYFRPGVRTKYPIVAAVLRLSTKYHAPQLRQRAIDLLTTAYPSTLSAWDIRSLERLVPPIEGEIGSLFALAVETDVRVFLPALYYAACKRPLSDMLTELYGMPVSTAVQQDICARFVVSREKLNRREIKDILAFLDPGFPRPNCLTSTDAGCLLRQGAVALPKSVDSETYQQWCSDHPSEVGVSLNLCQNCRVTVETSIKQARQRIWDNIPVFFGLPDWETLQGIDDELE